MEPALNTDRLALMQDRLLEAALVMRGLSFHRAVPDFDGRFNVRVGNRFCGLVYERGGRWFPVAPTFRETATLPPNGWRSRIHAAARLQSVRDLMDIETELALREVLRG